MFSKPLLLLLAILPLIVHSQTGEFSLLEYDCLDDVKRPLIVYSPESVRDIDDTPLLIYLHGAISNPNLKDDPLAYMKKSQLINLAEEGKFHLMFCYGQQGATWFDSVGTNMIMGELKQVIKQFKVDRDKVFLSGFSDGGSGALYMSMTHPQPFAGFISMNGSLKVAHKLGEEFLFPENSMHKPMYVINTTNDMLYPLRQIKPTIEYLSQFNQNITFSTPEGNHEMSYLETEEKEKIIAFIHKHERFEVVGFTWETKKPQSGTPNWIEISKIDTAIQKELWHMPYSVQVFNDKADFGVAFDYSYQGDGLKVSGFKKDNCTAQRMGVEIDDIILMMEEDTLTSPYSPYYYTSTKLAGEPTSLTILRKDQEQVLTGDFNEGEYYTIFNDSTKSAKIDVRLQGSVLSILTSNVSELYFHSIPVPTLMISEVFLNGQPFEGELKGKVVIEH